MRKISVVRMDGKRTKNESGIMRKITKKIMLNYYTILYIIDKFIIINQINYNFSYP
jgi:hypothetical protein